MKVVNLKEDWLRSHYIEQIKKFDDCDTSEKSLYQLVSMSAKLRAENSHKVQGNITGGSTNGQKPTK